MLLLQQVRLDQLGEVLARAELVPVLVVMLTALGAVWARAARWRLYFLPDRQVPFRPLLSTLFISYMASTFLPLRAGEVVRAYFLGERASVPLPRVIGTIVLEKLFDFLSIGVLLLAVLLTTPLPPVALGAGTTISLGILGGFGFVVALAVWREPTLRLLARVEGWLPFGVGRRLGLVRIARQFAEGTDSLRVRRLWLPMLGWSAVAWGFSLLGAWAGTAAVGISLSLPAITFLVVFTSAGQAVPSSPGYVGVYHAAAVFAMHNVFGVPQADALGSAILMHALLYGTLVVAGLLAMWVDGYGIDDLLRSIGARRGERAVDLNATNSANPLPAATGPRARVVAAPEPHTSAPPPSRA